VHLGARLGDPLDRGDAVDSGQPDVEEDDILRWDMI